MGKGKSGPPEGKPLLIAVFGSTGSFSPQALPARRGFFALGR